MLVYFLGHDPIHPHRQMSRRSLTSAGKTDISQVTNPLEYIPWSPPWVRNRSVIDVWQWISLRQRLPADTRTINKKQVHENNGFNLNACRVGQLVIEEEETCCLYTHMTNRINRDGE